MTKPIKMFQLDRLWSEIKDQTLDLIDKSNASGYGQRGPAVTQLETQLKSWSNRKHAITVASCTDALLCAIESLKLPRGSYIATPSLTFTAVASRIVCASMIPYFVDIDEYGHLDLNKIPEICSALIVVDLFGCAMDYDKLAIWQKNNPHCKVIMDAAQSIETIYNGQYSLSQGHIAVTSFSPSKTIPSWGSGGAIFTDDDEVAKFANLWRTHGKENNEDTAAMYGANSMLGTMEAAQILVVADKRHYRRARREEIAKHYINEMRLTTLKPLPQRGIHTWHKFVIHAGEYQDAVVARLKENNIECKVFYKPLIHQEPLYENFPQTDMTNSKKFIETTIAIPCQSTLNVDEVGRIGDILRSFKCV
jgi:UDP-2-acetamido-2-deoxy-ribo-hexuluronate aminotransferase